MYCFRGPLLCNPSREPLPFAFYVLLFVFWTSPDNPIQIEKARPDDTTYRGVFHVHSTESDGGGTVEEIAEAARGADLDFVIGQILGCDIF